MFLETNSPVPGSSIMDSPTLARVERAIQRQEGKNIFCCQSNQLPSHAIQKGLLWQQRDKLFSRWKERYFILTRDYLHCFRKSTENGPDRISDMGSFIFKIKLVEVDRVEWINKKNYSAIALDLGRDGRILLRCQNGLEDWFDMLEEHTVASKERRRALRLSNETDHVRGENDQNLNSVNSNMEQWIIARNKIAQLQRDHISDSVPDVFNLDIGSLRNSITTASCSGDDEDIWLPGNNKRLSLLKDFDMNAFDTPPPSMPPSLRGMRATPTPCRLNSDVFFLPGSGGARQRSSIAGSTVQKFSDKVSCYSRLGAENASTKSKNLIGSFRVPNMLQTTRGTANRYSLVEDSQSLKLTITKANTVTQILPDLILQSTKAYQTLFFSVSNHWKKHLLQQRGSNRLLLKLKPTNQDCQSAINASPLTRLDKFK